MNNNRNHPKIETSDSTCAKKVLFFSAFFFSSFLSFSFPSFSFQFFFPFFLSFFFLLSFFTCEPAAGLIVVQTPKWILYAALLVALFPMSAPPSTPTHISQVDPDAATPLPTSGAEMSTHASLLTAGSFSVTKAWLEIVSNDIKETGGAGFSHQGRELTRFLHSKFDILPDSATLAWFVAEVVPAFKRDFLAGDDPEALALGHIGTPAAWDVIAKRMPRSDGDPATPVGMTPIPLPDIIAGFIRSRDLRGLDTALRAEGLAGPVVDPAFDLNMRVKPGHEIDSTLNGLLNTESGAYQAEDKARKDLHSTEFTRRWFRTNGRTRPGTSGSLSPAEAFARGAFTAEELADDRADAATIAEQGTKDLSWRMLLSVMTPTQRGAINATLHRFFVAEDGGILRNPTAWRACLADPHCAPSVSWPSGFVPASLLVGLHLEYTGKARSILTETQARRRTRVYTAANIGVSPNGANPMPRVDPRVDPAVTWMADADRDRLPTLTRHLAKRAKELKDGSHDQAVKEHAASKEKMKKQGPHAAGSASS